MMAKKIAQRWMGASPIAGLLLLSLLWALSTLRADLLANLIRGQMPLFERVTVSFAMLTAVAGSLAVALRVRWPRGRQFWAAVFTGLFLFVVPAGLASVAGRSVNGYARTALLTLTPMFVIVFEPYIGGDSGTENRGSLLAALGVVAGAWCVFPVGVPETIEAGWGFGALMAAAACVAAANCLAVLEAKRQEKSTASMAAIAGATAALAFASVSACTERSVWQWDALAPELLWSAAVELPALLLLFWLMRRMSALRMATRYVISPLMAILIGALLTRSALAPRTWLGLLLMAAGSAYLLFAQKSDTELGGLMLR